MDDKDSQNQSPDAAAGSSKEDQPVPVAERQDTPDPKLSAEPRVVRYDRDGRPVFGPPMGDDE